MQETKQVQNVTCTTVASTQGNGNIRTRDARSGLPAQETNDNATIRGGAVLRFSSAGGRGTLVDPRFDALDREPTAFQRAADVSGLGVDGQAPAPSPGTSAAT